MSNAVTIDPALHAELESIYALYAALMRGCNDSLGGKLLYAGELDRDGARLVRAANIAGAASLSATSDAAAQRQAIREGVTDFLVTSLDEALRILKNEIRKRNPVAVGIAAEPSQIAAEMIDRGVLPDLLRQEIAEFIAQGAQIVEPAAPSPDHELLVVATSTADFESRALAALSERDFAAQRWLRLSPRYLGPHARRIRSIHCNHAIAEKLKAES